MIIGLWALTVQMSFELNKMDIQYNNSRERKKAKTEKKNVEKSLFIAVISHSQFECVQRMKLN